MRFWKKKKRGGDNVFYKATTEQTKSARVSVQTMVKMKTPNVYTEIFIFDEFEMLGGIYMQQYLNLCKCQILCPVLERLFQCLDISISSSKLPCSLCLSKIYYNLSLKFLNKQSNY